jgi:hypothetical protein
LLWIKNGDRLDGRLAQRNEAISQMNKQKEKLNSDVYCEDRELIDSLKGDSSRMEAIHLLCEFYRGKKPLSDNESEPEKVLSLRSTGDLKTYTQYKEDFGRDRQPFNPKQERLDKTKERMEETYLIEKARQKAKTEGEAERAQIKETSANKLRFINRYVRGGKPQVDWGDSEDSGDSFSLGDTR